MKLPAPNTTVHGILRCDKCGEVRPITSQVPDGIRYGFLCPGCYGTATVERLASDMTYAKFEEVFNSSKRKENPDD